MLNRKTATAKERLCRPRLRRGFGSGADFCENSPTNSADESERKERISACFRHEHCEACDKRDSCVTKSAGKGRYLRYRYKDVRLHRRRAYEKTAEFREKYRYRAGIEATNSELARRTGIKKLRYRGLKKVGFCVKLKAAGLNILRAAAYKRKKEGKNPYSGPLAWLLTGLLIIKERISNQKQQIWEDFVFSMTAEIFGSEFPF